MVSEQTKNEVLEVNKLLELTPEEIELREKERDLSIIGNKYRLKILFKLIEIGKMNFNKIAKALKIDTNKLTYHITLLRNGNFISNEKKIEEGKSISYYSITDKGKQYIQFLSNQEK